MLKLLMGVCYIEIMIKAIFFDFDGVLALEYGGGVAIARHLSSKLNRTYESVFSTYSKYAEQLVLTHNRFDTILDPLNKELESNFTLEDIIEATKAATPNNPMLELANTLRNKGYLTGIITDNNIDRIEILTIPFGLSDFRPLIVSANVGAGKWQDETIFNAALSEANVEAADSVFIDNTDSNLKVPSQLGIHTYFYDDTSNDVGALKDWLSGLNVKVQ